LYLKSFDSAAIANMGRTLVAKVVQVFDIPPNALWPIVGPGWGGIKLWIPGIYTCSLSTPNVEVGAVRSFRGTMGELQERMEVYAPEEYFTSYRVVDPNGTTLKGLYGNCKLEPKGETATTITWWADAEETDEEGLAVAGKNLTSLFEDSLSNLHKLLEA